MSKVDDIPLAKLFQDHLLIISRAEGIKLIGRKILDILQYRAVDRLGVKDPVFAEMADFELAVLQKAHATIAMLDTEQYRQREAIKLYLHGRITREELRRYSETWNGDKL
jgi:hypothetical protein